MGTHMKGFQLPLHTLLMLDTRKVCMTGFGMLCALHALENVVSNAPFMSLTDLAISEVSTEGVGARKSFICQRFRPLFCTFFPMPP